MKRHECLKEIADLVGDALCVVCVGGTSSEWNAYHPSDGNLRCWTLGLASSISLGMALGLPKRRVIALDGDGALLMNLCGLPTIMRKKPKNLIHIVFDNGIYESSGGTKTATTEGVDFVSVAKGVGIKNSFGATSTGEFKKLVCRRDESLGTYFYLRPSRTGQRRSTALAVAGRREQVSIHAARRTNRRHIDFPSAPSRKLEEELKLSEGC